MIVWGAPDWAWPAIGLGVLALGFVAWSYRRTGGRAGARGWAAGFKLAGLLLLLAAIVEPRLLRVQARPGANQLLVLVDDSASLAIRDADAENSRADSVRALLSEERGWLTRAEQDFDVRHHAFDRRLRAFAGPDELTFGGDSSHIAAALTQLAKRSAGRPVAGVVLVTDGLSTDGLEPGDDWESLGAIHPVVIGDAPGRDLSLGVVEVTQTNFEESPVTLAVDLSSTKCDGERVEVELFDREGVRLERQVVTADDDAPVEVRFDAPPDATGVRFYRVRAALAASELREATEANNERWALVDRGAGPYRVLYVSGRPNWEFKFLARAVAEDPELDLVGLVRIARSQPKFTFRDGADRRNQLWDGFDNRGEDVAEELDEPVLLRLGRDLDEFDLRAGFPSAADELFAYDALVLDDLEAEFFTPDQQALIEDFVARRGGGFLALGGRQAFAGSGYRRTPFEGILPVYLDGVAAEGAPARAWQLELTRDGWLEPWVRLRSTEEAERERLAELTSFRTLNRVGEPKPGAQVLMVARNTASELRPALVAQRFGKGRSAALALGDLWRWDLARPDPAVSDLGAAWRQLLRWLVAEVPGRVELGVVAGAGEGVHVLRAALRDEDFAAVRDATLTLLVTPPDGLAFELSAAPSTTEPGVWEAEFVPRASGPWRAELVASAPDGSALGADEAGWVLESVADEFVRLAPDRAGLAELARRTGGELLAPEDLDAFAADLARRDVPITEERLDPLWHRWWVFLLALACFCAEWGVRRFHGMP